MTKTAIEPRARDLFDEAIVIDGLDVSDFTQPDVLHGLQAGGITAINATNAVWEDFEQALSNLSDWYARFDAHAEWIRPGRSTADIRAAKRENRTAVIFGWQNAAPFGSDLRRVRQFFELGLRTVQLTYNERNLYGNGCWEITDEGLSRIGRDLIHEMNDVGILIDLSHCGDQTTLETIEHSKKPVAITHAYSRTTFDHPRNKDDSVIKRLAERGGIIGTNAFPTHYPRGFEASVDDFVDAMEYLIELVGVQHVAIGTDFCMGRDQTFFAWITASHGRRRFKDVANDRVRRFDVIPKPYRHLRGLESPQEFVNIADRLVRRGHTDNDIRDLLGGNWLRLFDEVWGKPD